MIPPPDVDFIQAQRSFTVQHGLKSNWKSDIRGYWSGQSAEQMAFTVMDFPELHATYNLSDEQYKKLKDWYDNIDSVRDNDPEHQKFLEEIRAMNNPDDPFPLNVDEETKNKMIVLEGWGIAWMNNYYSTGIRSILTPEQMRKIQETHLANMEDFPIISPYLFEALDLTDAQKQQMKEIKEELEPEFEKNLEDFVNGQLYVVNRMYDELEKRGVKDIEAMMKELSAVENLLAKDPDCKRAVDHVQTIRKQFATRFKTRMLDVLTNEQWTRLQKLIDDPPEHVKAVRKKFGMNKGESEKSQTWTLGPDSWKPGDGVPEEYRQERNKRTRRGFPRAED
jgi:Ni/Co efflux regulator RcnB